ncbi:MAG: hypothetical protein HQM09_09605 [Candidatus Riflebacteria bacterium]|nr:hypothetical protein [Candidatus Riflebacteria bacterium]
MEHSDSPNPEINISGPGSLPNPIKITDVSRSPINSASRLENILPALLLTTIFLLLEMLLAGRHEPWRDEINAWLIARYLPSPMAIVRHLATYDVHPSLWYLILYAWKYISPSIAGMQLLHLLIAASTVFILAWRAPFSWPAKLLLTGSYFLAYEYAVICRNYGIGILFLFAACSLFSFRRHQMPLMGLLLLSAAHTSVLAWIIVIAFAGMLAMDRWCAADPLDKGEFFGFLIIALGVASAGLQFALAAKGVYVPKVQTSFDPERFTAVLGTLSRALIPIPQWESYFWCTNALDLLDPTGILAASLSLLMIGILLGSVRNRPILAGFFSVSTVGLFSLFYVNYLGYVRHWGFHGVLWVMVFWLESEIPEQNTGKKIAGISWLLMRRRTLSAGILTAQLIAFLMAAWIDWHIPFSQAPRVADFIREQGLSNSPLAGDGPTEMVSVAGYLELPFYAPRIRDTWLYWLITGDSLRSLSSAEFLGRWSEWATRNATSSILVCNYFFPPDLESSFHLERLATFQGAIVVDEQYVIYRRKPSWNTFIKH